MSRIDVYLAAARCFADLIPKIPRERLDDPGLGDWSIRSLIGHTSRALITVETYLARPAHAIQVDSAAEYYAAVARAHIDAAEVRERGIQAGQDLGDDLAASIEAHIVTVTHSLCGLGGAHLLDTLVGGMRLDEYLRTRTFELAVHTLDLSAAARIEYTLPLSIQLDAAGLAAEASVVSGSGHRLLLALTGRATLPRGFSIVG